MRHYTRTSEHQTDVSADSDYNHIDESYRWIHDLWHHRVCQGCEDWSSFSTRLLTDWSWSLTGVKQILSVTSARHFIGKYVLWTRVWQGPDKTKKFIPILRCSNSYNICNAEDVVAPGSGKESGSKLWGFVNPMICECYSTAQSPVLRFWSFSTPIPRSGEVCDND